MTCSDVSTVNYRDMGHGMGQRDFLKFSLNYLTQNIKEKFRKPSGFRNFYGCGGRTRTYDLRVMRAYFLISSHKVTFNYVMFSIK